MRSWDWDWIGVCIGGIIGLLILVFVFTWAGRHVWAERVCLQAGWKDSQVAWDFSAYCIREENEYEIVKPIGEV